MQFRFRRLSLARPSGGVTDEGNAFSGPWLDEAAAGNAPHPPRDGARALKTKNSLGFAKEGSQMRPPAGPAATPAWKTEGPGATQPR